MQDRKPNSNIYISPWIPDKVSVSRLWHYAPAKYLKVLLLALSCPPLLNAAPPTTLLVDSSQTTTECFLLHQSTGYLPSRSWFSPLSIKNRNNRASSSTRDACTYPCLPYTLLVPSCLELSFLNHMLVQDMILWLHLHRCLCPALQLEVFIC